MKNSFLAAIGQATKPFRSAFMKRFDKAAMSKPIARLKNPWIWAAHKLALYGSSGYILKKMLGPYAPENIEKASESLSNIPSDDSSPIIVGTAITVFVSSLAVQALKSRRDHLVDHGNILKHAASMNKSVDEPSEPQNI